MRIRDLLAEIRELLAESIVARWFLWVAICFAVVFALQGPLFGAYDDRGLARSALVAVAVATGRALGVARDARRADRA